MLPRRTLQIAVASLLLLPGVARAGDPATAESLFDEGKLLMRQGRYVEACPKFEESQKIDAGLGTKFQLANCWQQLGRTASAWGLFREVESEARALGQVGRERVAHDRAVALVPWLSKIAISSHGAGAGVAVLIRRDGVEVGREQWDTPLPVDPGKHVVTAIAPNKQPWQTAIEVPSDGKIVTVDIPPLADVAHPSVADAGGRRGDSVAPVAAPPMRPATGVTSSMPPSMSETAIVEDRGSGQRSVGWLFVGTGVAGLVAGVYFAAQWIDERGLSNAHCGGGSCDALGTSLRSDGRLQGIAAEATVGGGAAAFLLGAVLVASAPRPRLVIAGSTADRPTLRVTPIVGVREAGFGLNGAF
jgi:hypothetical protein